MSRGNCATKEAGSELVFAVEQAPEGGFVARALGHSNFTEADDLDGLRDAVRDAVRCHFDNAKPPQVIRLHFLREEVQATVSRPLAIATVRARSIGG